MSSVNKDSIMSSFTICIPVISFSCLIPLGRISSTTLKSSGEKEETCFIPDVSGEVFHHKYDINSKFSSYNLFFLIMNGCSDQIRSVAQSCPTLCDPMNRSTPGLPVHHQLPEFTQTHIHRVNDAIQLSHPLSSPSPSAPNPSQHQSLFQ